MLNHMLTGVLPALVLGLALFSAIWHDVRSRKIPNRLIVCGALAGVLLHTLLPAGSGLFNTPPGGLGILYSLAGFIVGLLFLLPFYALRALGAGDVKLMAMVGAYIGAAGVIGATLLAMLAGGVLALAVALWSGQLSQVVGNVQHMLRHGLSRTAGADSGAGGEAAPPPLTGKLAYAIAIACGTAGQLMLAGSPAWRLFS